MLWGWLVAMIPIQCLAFSVAELCSAMPTSGGLYYVAAKLAPKGYGPLAAWITCWSSFIAHVTETASVNYALASMILAGISISKPSYAPTNVHTWALSSSLMILDASLASLPTKFLSKFNFYGTLLNVGSLLAVIILIPLEAARVDQLDSSTGKVMDRFAKSADVWGSIRNSTDYPNGISVIMSCVGVIWTLSGFEAAFDISQECTNASTAAPRAIVVSHISDSM